MIMSADCLDKDAQGVRASTHHVTVWWSLRRSAFLAASRDRCYVAASLNADHAADLVLAMIAGGYGTWDVAAVEQDMVRANKRAVYRALRHRRIA